MKLEINPVFRRDSRVRWRGKASHLSLLLLAVAACGVVLWAYYDNNLSRRNAMDSGRGGRELFVALSYMQLCVWLLIVPGLTAPGIAFERERGLLEALQLSGMRPGRIVLGKLAAVMMFIAQLLLVTAPPLAVCFMMGGVDYEEFRSVFMLQIATIFLAATIGIYFSSRARRSLQAVCNAYVTVLIWTVGLFFCLVVLDSALGPSFMTNFPAVWLVILIHPAFVMQSVFDASQATRLFSSMGFAVWPFDWEFSTVFVASECGIALLLLWRAAVNAGRVLPDVQLAEPRKRGLTLRRGRLKVSELADSKSQRSAQVWQAPLTELLQFRNPVLQREIHGWLRFRRSSRTQIAARIVGAAFYIFTLLAALLGLSFEVWNWTNNLLLWLVVPIVPMRGAYAIARERENGTWESLRLSLLSAEEIVWGKALAPLLFSLGVLAVLAPIGLLCVTNLYPESHATVVPVYVVLVMAALLLSYVFFYSAWSLWISWRCRATTAAFGWTVGPLFIWLFIANVFGPDWRRHFNANFDTILIPGDRRFFADVALFFNPFHEWNFLWQRTQAQDGGQYYPNYSNWGHISEWPGTIPGDSHAEAAIVALIVFGLLVLWDVVRSIKRRTTLESEAKR